MLVRKLRTQEFEKVEHYILIFGGMDSRYSLRKLGLYKMWFPYIFRHNENNLSPVFVHNKCDRNDLSIA